MPRKIRCVRNVAGLVGTNVSRLYTVHLALQVLRSWIERACRFIASTNLFFDCAIVRFLGLRTRGKKKGRKSGRRGRFQCFSLASVGIVLFSFVEINGKA